MRGLRAEVLVEPGDGPLVGAQGIGAFETVARSRNRLQFRRDARRDEAIHQPKRLLISHVGIGRPMNRQNGRRIRVHPIERAGAHLGQPVVVEIATQELRQNIGGIDRFRIGLGEVGGAVFIDHALHAAGLFAMGAGALELVHAGGEPQHQHEMTARAAAERADMLGVNGILRRVGTEETDGRFRVLERSRELISRGQAIGDGRGNVAVLGQFHGQRNVTLLGPGAKTSAVHQQDRGTRRGGSRSRANDIHRLATADRRVRDVALGDDCIRDRLPQKSHGQDEKKESTHLRDYIAFR